MAKIERFEDMACWQKGRELTRLVYRSSRGGQFARDPGLCTQIRRASVSITSNIAEGFERGGDKEFTQFLSQAKASCGEVRSQLYVALDEGYLEKDQFETMYQMTLEISRMISGLITYLNRSAYRGSKYK